MVKNSYALNRVRQSTPDTINRWFDLGMGVDPSFNIYSGTTSITIEPHQMLSILT